MEFGEHWLQRLSLVLARGQGDLVLEAVKSFYIQILEKKDFLQCTGTAFFLCMNHE